MSDKAVALAYLGVVFAVGIGVIVRDDIRDRRAFERITTLERTYPYVLTCDADGKPGGGAMPNCVDLGEAVFVHGDIDRLFVKQAADRTGEVLAFASGVYPSRGMQYLVPLERALSASLEKRNVSGG